MPKYMIHACNAREWYVTDYLIPSMLDQGIARSDIILWLDRNNDGCLESCMKSFALIEEFDFDGMWHLQDDVIIGRNFKKRTEELDTGLVCGFCCDYDVKRHNNGVVGVVDMWFSFPCIRIPNKIAVECARWFYTNCQNNNFEITHFAKSKKNDDLLFKYFLERYHMSDHAILVNPNLVDHIDYLLGGSIVNKQRDKIVRSTYFEDLDLIEKLENQLKK